MGGRHLTVIVGTLSGAFVNENCPLGRALYSFFQMPASCPGVCAEGMPAKQRYAVFYDF